MTKKGEQPLNVDLPKALNDEVNRLVAEFTPWRKKQVVGAVLAFWANASPAVRKLIVAAGLPLYDPKTKTLASALAESVGNRQTLIRGLGSRLPLPPRPSGKRRRAAGSDEAS